jgi:hypothetical protein
MEKVTIYFDYGPRTLLVTHLETAWLLWEEHHDTTAVRDQLANDYDMNRYEALHYVVAIKNGRWSPKS